jgi:signal transduction histidine kinase
MKLFRDYFRRQPGALAVPLFCAGVFAVILYLYRLPAEGALYGLGLCLAGGLPCLAAGFFSWRRRVRLLEELRRRPGLREEDLPAPRDALEAGWRELLEETLSAGRTRREALERAARESADTYTLWAHQIKTPISAMRLILQQEPCPAAGELSEQLLLTEQYADMVMAYVRATSEHTDFLLRPCPLEPLVRRTVKHLSLLFIRREISLELGPLPGSPVTDEKWLGFALEQVLTNALKYTPKGGKITISAAGDVLTVRDTGVGIAPEDLPRVFEKGFTGRNGRLDERASGIGLYLSRKVLQRLGHGIQVDSAPGAGTTVRFLLASREISPV